MVLDKTNCETQLRGITEGNKGKHFIQHERTTGSYIKHAFSLLVRTHLGLLMRYIMRPNADLARFVRRVKREIGFTAIGTIGVQTCVRDTTLRRLALIWSDSVTSMVYSCMHGLLFRVEHPCSDRDKRGTHTTRSAYAATYAGLPGPNSCAKTVRLRTRKVTVTSHDIMWLLWPV